MPSAAALLAWYDRHRRRLPWRALPGEAADPYRIWLSEIMLQHTTVAAVIPYYEKFLTRFPDVGALAAAEEGEVMRAWAVCRTTKLNDRRAVSTERPSGEAAETGELHEVWREVLCSRCSGFWRFPRRAKLASI